MRLPRAWTLGFLLLIGAFLAVDTLTQLAFKLAADGMGDLPLGTAYLVAAAHTPAIWIAAALYGVTYVLWMVVLQRTPLSQAFPLTALSYVTVPAAAWLAFGETIGPIPLAGIVLILGGVCLIGHESAEPEAAAPATADPATTPSGAPAPLPLPTPRPVPCAD